MAGAYSLNGSVVVERGAAVVETKRERVWWRLEAGGCKGCNEKGRTDPPYPTMPVDQAKN